MEKFDLRLDQLKYQKVSSFLRLVIFFALGNALLIIIVQIINFIINRQDFFIFDDFVFFAFGLGEIPLIVLLIIYYAYLDRKFINSYVETLISEVRLEDIYFLKNTPPKQEELINHLKKIFFLKKIDYYQGYSLASTSLAIDLFNVKYNDNIKVNKGMLIILNFNLDKDLFLQICKENFYASRYYENDEINRYGFNNKNKVLTYNVYSNSNYVYSIISNEGKKYFKNLINYLKSEVNIVLDDGTLFILVKKFKIKTYNHLYKFITSEVFDEKILAIKHLNDYLFELANYLQKLLENFEK